MIVELLRGLKWEGTVQCAPSAPPATNEFGNHASFWSMSRVAFDTGVFACGNNNTSPGWIFHFPLLYILDPKHQ